MNDLEFSDFLKVDMRVGEIMSAILNKKAHKPAYVLEIDFGELGIKISSAQIVDNYSIKELIGKQIVAVVNFPSKRIAEIKSEVLVLASVSEERGTILIFPSIPSKNGSKIS